MDTVQGTPSTPRTVSGLKENYLFRGNAGCGSITAPCATTVNYGASGGAWTGDLGPLGFIVGLIDLLFGSEPTGPYAVPVHRVPGVIYADDPRLTEGGGDPAAPTAPTTPPPPGGGGSGSPPPPSGGGASCDRTVDPDCVNPNRTVVNTAPVTDLSNGNVYLPPKDLDGDGFISPDELAQDACNQPFSAEFEGGMFGGVLTQPGSTAAQFTVGAGVGIVIVPLIVSVEASAPALWALGTASVLVDTAANLLYPGDRLVATPQPRGRHFNGTFECR